MKVETREPLRTILFSLGIVNVILAIAGALLPVLPAGPFIIAAAYFFSKSSAKFHTRLRESPLTGHVVREWEDHGVITWAAKAGLALFVVSSLGYSLYFDTPKAVPISIGLVGGAFLAWVFSRPSK